MTEIQYMDGPNGHRLAYARTEGEGPVIVFLSDGEHTVDEVPLAGIDAVVREVRHVDPATGETRRLLASRRPEGTPSGRQADSSARAGALTWATAR